MAFSITLTHSAEWMPLGPFGGAAMFVLVDPHCSKNIIVGTKNAALFRSQNGGESWTPLPFPAQTKATLQAIVLDRRVPGVIMAGLSTSDSVDCSGVLRSADGGLTWQQLLALRGKDVRALAMWPGDSMIIAAGTQDGVYLTRDGGTTWSRISPAENRELQPVVSLAFDPGDSSVIYAGTPHLPWKTIDGGATWRRINAGIQDDSDIFSIQVDRNSSQRIFAAACSGIYRSVNGGSTWAKLRGAKGASYRTYAIVQDPLHANVLYVGTTHGLAKSEDRGNTWAMTLPYTTRGISFDLAHIGRIFVATEQAGILRSDDSGTSWRETNRGFCNRVLFGLSSTDGGNLYVNEVNGERSSGFRLSNQNDFWENVSSAQTVPSRDQPSARCAQRTKKTAGTSFPISENAADGWKEADLPESDGVLQGDALLNSPWPDALTTLQTFLSADATNWKANTPVPQGVEVFGLIGTGGKSFLAATSSGLFSSDDLGTSWQAVQGEHQGNTITAICRHPTWPSLIFLARYGSIYASSDRGGSWVKLPVGPCPTGAIKQLVAVPGAPDRLFALTRRQGVYALPLDVHGSGIAGLPAHLLDDFHGAPATVPQH